MEIRAKKIMRGKITAVLLNWERPQNVRLILKALIGNRLIGEIILWNNNSSAPLLYVHPKLKIINSPKNFFTLARYAAATLAEYETILFQDDDLLLSNQQIEMLYGAYANDHERIYGCFGRNIRDSQYIAQDIFGEVDMIAGRMMLFHKSLLHNFFRCLCDIPDMPGPIEDDILFSLCQKRKHLAIDVGRIKELPDPFALSGRAEHYERRQAMVDFCLNKRILEPMI